MSVVDSLRAAIRARLGDVTETGYRTESWHSATFAGTRHLLSFEIPANANVTTFARDIAEAEIELPRGFVADVDVTGMGARRIEVVALTIDA